jgi:transcriptional regulator with XRE-family HTH domain
MRLADLCQANGFSLSAVAAAVGVNPVLLTNIDLGRQPLPRVLAAQIASLLRVSVADVQASVPLNTDLNDPLIYRALPPVFGALIPPARIFPTQAVVISPPSLFGVYVDRTETIDYVARASGNFIVRRV